MQNFPAIGAVEKKTFDHIFYRHQVFLGISGKFSILLLLQSFFEFVSPRKKGYKCFSQPKVVPFRGCKSFAATCSDCGRDAFLRSVSLFEFFFEIRFYFFGIVGNSSHTAVNLVRTTDAPLS